MSSRRCCPPVRPRAARRGCWWRRSRSGPSPRRAPRRLPPSIRVLLRRHAVPAASAPRAAGARSPPAARRGPYEYYMGTTGGGVFKTTDGGMTWAPVTDKIGSTVGAVGVCRRTPTSSTSARASRHPRQHLHGDGVWRPPTPARRGPRSASTAGRLASRAPDQLRHRVRGRLGQRRRAPPSAACSSPRTAGRPGSGRCFRDDPTGAIDLSIDPSNPNVLYAALWQAYRTLVVDVERRAGQRPLQVDRRRRDVDRAHAEPRGCRRACRQDRPRRVAGRPEPRVGDLEDEPEGGVFRSDDAGDTWTHMNDDRNLRQRAWYYSRIYADPKDKDTRLRAERAVLPVDRRRQDVHADPRAARRQPRPVDRAERHPKRMVEANDGGANVTFNGGADLDGAGLRDGAVLPRRHDQARPVPRLRRAAGQLHAAGPGAGRGRRGSLPPTGTPRRRRERLHRAASDRPRASSTPAATAGCSRGRTRDRAAARGQRLPGQPHGPLRQGPEGPLPVDVPDRLLAARPERALRGVAAPLPHDERGPELGAHQPRPHARRPATMGPRAARSRRTRPASRRTRRSSRSRPSPQDADVIWTGSDDGWCTSRATTARRGRT